MPGLSFLTSQQLHEFDVRGVLRLVGLFSPDRVRAAREHVQQRLARLGQGGACLGDNPRSQRRATGAVTSRMIGSKHPTVEALLEEPALLSAVAELLEGRAFDRKLYPRPQLLVTLPGSQISTIGWHADCPRLASGRRPGVQLFTFLDTLGSGGGGTLMIAGSHRLLNEGRCIREKELRGLLCQHTFFQELYTGEPVSMEDRVRWVDKAGAVGDVALEVVELTGAPGDAYFTDLRVLHAGSPNASARPRMMATHRFLCADIAQELSDAYGWGDPDSR
jgi:hypothetical protein